MHELSYVIKIIDMAARCAKENGLSRVESIRVEVGAMTGALPEYLKMYFERSIKDPALEGAGLDIINIPVLAECECGNKYEPSKENGYLCPVCKSSCGRIIQGRDIVVVSVAGTS